jgi:hypothetical protein
MVAMSFLAVPSVKRLPWGLLGLVLNVLPVLGVGSILAGIKGNHRGTLVVGIVQAVLHIGLSVLMVTSGTFWPILALFAVWVWSIVWGVRIFLASGNETPSGAGPATVTTTSPSKGKAKKA